ncbi:MAG TPA: IreB family regulatory phosphoprotein [Clostridiales bacterium]|nr:IreB family regulatory phosphoprotein [Clostridiales bacterium]
MAENKNIDGTVILGSLEKGNGLKTRETIDAVYDALVEKGYNPINQIVGYILSGDPTYITNYKNARSIVRRIERDELLEEIIKYYLQGRRSADSQSAK